MIVFKDYKLLSLSEHKRLLELRNSDEVRLSSNDTSVILLENHLAWCEGLESGRYFAIYENDVLLGGVNVNDDFWGVFFAPQINPFIKLACAYRFLQKCLESRELLRADIRKTNVKALELNQFFGFEIKSQNGDFYLLELKKTDLQIKNQRVKEKIKNFEINYKE